MFFEISCILIDLQLPRANVNQTEDEKKTIALEGHLEQLLISQEKQRTLDLVRRQQEVC